MMKPMDFGRSWWGQTLNHERETRRKQPLASERTKLHKIYKLSQKYCEEMTVTDCSGMDLNGWHMETKNGAAAILLHGAPAFPYHLMEEAAMLQRHGYGALLTIVRNHNFSDGDTISFGYEDREMEDLEDWYQYLIRQDGVDSSKIDLLGQTVIYLP